MASHHPRYYIHTPPWYQHMMDTFITCNIAAVLRWAVGFFMGIALMCFINDCPGWGAIACLLNMCMCMSYEVVEALLNNPTYQVKKDLLTTIRE